MRLSEIIENDKLIRFIMENNIEMEKLRTGGPKTKRVEERVIFLIRLRNQIIELQREWEQKQ